METQSVVVDHSALVASLQSISKWEMKLIVPMYTLDKLDFIKGRVDKQGKAARDAIRLIEANLGKNIALRDTPVNVNLRSKCPSRYKPLIQAVIAENHTTLVTLDAVLIEWSDRNDIAAKTPHQVDAMLVNNVVKVDEYAERGTGQLWTPPSSCSNKRARALR